MKLSHSVPVALAMIVLQLPMAAGPNTKQILDVSVLGRQDSETAYTVTVPGQTTATAATAPNGGSAVQVTTTQSRTRSQQVRGATLSLLLPDGRVAIVNCESKYAPRGNHINRRSCRVPQVDKLKVEFDGDKAKLMWGVSIDGSKTESETYRIISVVDKH